MSDERQATHTWTDYSGELNLSSNPLLRGLYLALGFVCVGLGVIGIFVPGWPTTVWILVATFFFARSSPHFYNWLMNHRTFGPLIRDFRSGRGIPLGTKAFAISMITLFAGSSALFLISRAWISWLVVAVGLTGILYLLRLPTKRRTSG